MKKGWSGVVAFATGAALSAVTTLAVAPIWTGAVAQEQALGTEGAADIAALKAQLDALEKKVQRMDDEHSTIRAPFTVVGPDKKAILTVSDEAGRTRVTVGNVGGAHVIVGMTEQGSGMSFKDSGGATRVQIAAGADLSQIWVEDKLAKTVLGSSTDGTQSGLRVTKGDTLEIALATDKAGGSLKTFDVSGVPIAEISATDDTPLLLYDLAGKPFFSVGLPEGSKQVLTLGDPAAARVELGLFTARAGSFVSVIDKAGMQRATMTADQEEFPFSASDEKGKDIFSVGPVDKTGPVQMTIGDATAAHVQLGLFAGESGSFVSALDRTAIERAALTADSEEPPISVSDAQGKKVFTVGPATEAGGGGPLRLTLGEENAAHVRMGLYTGDSGTYFNLYDNAAKLRAAVTADASAVPISLYDPQDQPIFTVGALDAPLEPDLVLGHPTTAHLKLGVLKGGSGTYVSLYDDGNQERASITATEKSTQMSLNDANMTADLGSDLVTDKAGLFMSKGEMNYASIRFNKAEGGSVRIGDPQGKGVVELAAGGAGEGGRVAVAGPGGGKAIAKFWGAEAGGKLGLYDTAGNARATMTATSAGDLGLFSEAGWLNMNSGETAPRFQIMDAAGTVMVQAGIAAGKNVGLVQVGPGGNGAAATLGNMGLAASQIIGKK